MSDALRLLGFNSMDHYHAAMQLEIETVLRRGGALKFQQIFERMRLARASYTPLQFNIQILGLILQKRVRIVYDQKQDPHVQLWEHPGAEPVQETVKR